MSSCVGVGVLSTANIGRKVIAAIRDSGAARLTCVGSRSLEKAEAFVSEIGANPDGVAAPRALGAYEDVLLDEDTSVVYVPLPTSLKREWCVRAARAGKHVICEKPFASCDDVRAIAEACREAGVFFVDGTMFEHSSRLRAWSARHAALEGRVGSPRATQVSAAFAFHLTNDADIRLNASLEPLGSLGDLAWYCVRAVLHGFPRDETKVTARCTATWSGGERGSGVPVDCSGTLTFACGAQASIQSSFSTSFRQTLEVCGPEGRVVIDDFVLHEAEPGASTVKTSFAAIPNYDPGMKPPAVVETTESRRQEVEMIVAVAAEAARAGDQGRGDSARDWCSIAWRTQACVDALMESARNDGAPVEVDIATGEPTVA